MEIQDVKMSKRNRGKYHTMDKQVDTRRGQEVPSHQLSTPTTSLLITRKLDQLLEQEWER